MDHHFFHLFFQYSSPIWHPRLEHVPLTQSHMANIYDFSLHPILFPHFESYPFAGIRIHPVQHDRYQFSWETTTTISPVRWCSTEFQWIIVTLDSIYDTGSTIIITRTRTREDDDWWDSNSVGRYHLCGRADHISWRRTTMQCNPFRKRVRLASFEEILLERYLDYPTDDSEDRLV